MVDVFDKALLPVALWILAVTLLWATCGESARCAPFCWWARCVRPADLVVSVRLPMAAESGPTGRFFRTAVVQPAVARLLQPPLFDPGCAQCFHVDVSNVLACAIRLLLGRTGSVRESYCIRARAIPLRWAPGCPELWVPAHLQAISSAGMPADMGIRSCMNWPSDSPRWRWG